MPELDPAQIVGRYSEFNVDDTPLTEKDFRCCLKETQVAATAIAEEADLSRYQAGYTEDNERIELPNFQPVALTRARKQSFAPEVDPSSVISADAMFEALRSIQCSNGESTSQEGAGDDDNREESGQSAP